MAIAVASFSDSTQPLYLAGLADLLATVVVFSFSLAFRNSSFYDVYWSVAPPLLVGYWWLSGDGELARVLVVFVIVLTWAIRLTGNWVKSWRGLDHEDWRYPKIHDATGRLYWPVSFLGIHLVPTIVVFIGCLPLFIVTHASVRMLNVWDGVAFAVGTGAVYLEARADRELSNFRQSRTSEAEVLDQGVWAWCRHPNYLGEIGFWVALGLFGYAANPTLWWNWAGVVVMVVLFLGVSIPLIDAQLLASKPAYADYRRRVWSLVPGAGSLFTSKQSD